MLSTGESTTRTSNRQVGIFTTLNKAHVLTRGRISSGVDTIMIARGALIKVRQSTGSIYLLFVTDVGVGTSAVDIHRNQRTQGLGHLCQRTLRRHRPTRQVRSGALGVGYSGKQGLLARSIPIPPKRCLIPGHQHYPPIPLRSSELPVPLRACRNA